MTVLDIPSRWPSLAQDIALLAIPNSPISSVDDICQAYGLTEEELQKMLAVPYFQQLLEEAGRQLQGMGAKAGMRYRAMQLSQALAEVLFRKAHSGQMKDGDMLKLLDSLLKASGVEKEAVAQVNVQNNIALPFPPGVEKVSQFVAVEG